MHDEMQICIHCEVLYWVAGAMSVVRAQRLYVVAPQTGTGVFEESRVLLFQLEKFICARRMGVILHPVRA
jgi:hypothetical protein